MHFASTRATNGATPIPSEHSSWWPASSSSSLSGDSSALESATYDRAANHRQEPYRHSLLWRAHPRYSRGVGPNALGDALVIQDRTPDPVAERYLPAASIHHSGVPRRF